MRNKLLKSIFSGLVFSLSMLSLSAQAIIINDFTGDYDASNWVIDNSQGGSVVTSLSPLSVSLIEPDNGGMYTEVTFLTQALSDLTVTFDWTYDTSFDACCSSISFHGASGGPVTIANGGDFAGGTGTGTLSFAVASGALFGWGNNSEDSCCGANILTISNVSFDTTAVPEPSSLAIFILGALGLVSRRVKKISLLNSY